MFEHLHEHRVRYRESDPMGIVYHAHYLDYFEAARTEALRSLGMTYKAIEESGMYMPVVEASLTYKSPARYDDLIVIRTRAKLSESNTRLHFLYDVFRKDEQQVLVTGEVTLCFFDRKRARPIRAPEHLVKLFLNAETTDKS